MLAALVTLGFVISCLEDAGHIRVIAFMVLAGVSKDVALPFVILIGLGASALSQDDVGVRRPTRERLVALATGAVISAAVTLAFNYARFGGPVEPAQLMSLYQVPTRAIQASFFLAIWASPNGGIATFWPALVAFLVLCAAGARRAVLDSRGSRIQALIPALVVALALFGLTLGFSDWWAPLRWITWGPRLILPWVPACALLLAFAYAPEIDVLLKRLVSRSRLAMAGLLLLAAATLPQFVILARPTLWDPLWTPDAPCPRVPYVEQGVDYYYTCTIHQLWTKHSVLLDAYDPGVDPSSFIFGIVCCLGVVVASRRALTLPLSR